MAMEAVMAATRTRKERKTRLRSCFDPFLVAKLCGLFVAMISVNHLCFQKENRKSEISDRVEKKLSNDTNDIISVEMAFLGVLPLSENYHVLYVVPIEESFLLYMLVAFSPRTERRDIGHC